MHVGRGYSYGVAEITETQRKNSQRKPKKGGPGKPWAPGQSGNPGGRPKGFAALVRERCEEGVPLIEYGFRVLQGLEVSAEGGSIREQVDVARLRLEAAKWLAERGWGQPQQLIEHTGPDGGGLSIHIDLGAGK